MSNLTSVHLLGVLQVATPEQSVSRFRTRKIAGLLATIAYHDRKAFRREELIEILWPDSEPESGRNRLRIALCGLRHDLEPVRANDLVLADRLHVQLDPRAFTADTSAFNACLRAAKASTEEAEQRAQLERAVSLYTGDLLPGFDEPWIMGERERLREAYARALRRLVALLAQAGSPARALEYARRAADFDPLDEEACRTLMRLQMALQQPAGALTQFRRLETALQEQLGIAPSARLRELAAECRQLSAATPQPVNRAALTPDAAAEPVAPAPTPAPMSAPDLPPLPMILVEPPSRRRVPALTTTLYGRETALAELRALLEEPETRLVTLTGPGGIGKTTLTLALADPLAERYGADIWFVPLADIADAQRIPEFICRALELAHDDRRDPVEEIAAAVASRPVLLILDNFEHVAEQGAGMVQCLLEAAPQLCCLVTSRQRLRLAAEREYPVPPLAVPGSGKTVEALANCASVQLFVERAQHCRPGFALNAANAAEVAAICKRLDGMALGIELAASWTQVLTPAQIRVRFRASLSDLSSRYRGTPERHRSLHAVVQGSYAMLSAEAQRLFCALSVFRGSFGLEALEAIYPHPDFYELLAQLMDHSLLGLREIGGENRFTLLEPIREYAGTLLPEPERQELELLHARYYLRVAEEEEDWLRGPQTVRALERIDLEMPNLLVALERFSEHPTLGILLTGALWCYWYLRGQYRAGCDWLDRALRCEYTGPWRARAVALRGAANLAYLISDYVSAQRWNEEALALCRANGDLRGVASTLIGLGSIAHELGDLTQALSLQNEAHQIFIEIQHNPGMARALGNLAATYRMLGDLDGALSRHLESVELLRQAGIVDSLAEELVNLGRTQCRRGDFANARRALNEAQELDAQIQMRAILAASLEVYGEMAVREGRMERAARLFGKQEALNGELGVKPVSVDYPAYLDDCAQVRTALGDLAYAEAWARGSHMTDDEAIALARET